jgi:hypothetical protein
VLVNSSLSYLGTPISLGNENLKRKHKEKNPLNEFGL